MRRTPRKPKTKPKAHRARRLRTPKVIAAPKVLPPEPEVEWPGGRDPYAANYVPDQEAPPPENGSDRAYRSIMRAGMMLAELRWRRGED